MSRREQKSVRVEAGQMIGGPVGTINNYLATRSICCPSRGCIQLMVYNAGPTGHGDPHRGPWRVAVKIFQLPTHPSDPQPEIVRVTYSAAEKDSAVWDHDWVNKDDQQFFVKSSGFVYGDQHLPAGMGSDNLVLDFWFDATYGSDIPQGSRFPLPATAVDNWPHPPSSLFDPWDLLTMPATNFFRFLPDGITQWDDPSCVGWVEHEPIDWMPGSDTRLSEETKEFMEEVELVGDVVFKGAKADDEGAVVEADVRPRPAS